MTAYKYSIYNILCKDNNKVFLWNTFTGAIASLNEMGLLALEDLNKLSINDSLFEDFLNNGFIVDKNIDEYERIVQRANFLLNNANSEDLFFVISPTLKCNYSCEYCFERDRTMYSSMDKDTEDLTIKYIKNKIAPPLKRLHITWFGGEPLINIDTIVRISNQLIEFCDSNNIEYRGSLLTNGRYLTEENILRLKNLRLKKIQISMDGTQEFYCRNKKASVSDYETTIRNIRSACKIFSNVLIRINIFNNSFDEAYLLTDEILSSLGLNDNIKIYLACVNYGNNHQRLENYSTFVDEELKFRKWFKEKYTNYYYFCKRPVSRGVPCSLACFNNFCIGPLGELYKCEHHFGNSNLVIGNIKDNASDEKLKTYADYVNRVINNPKCMKCQVFPICMGGCPNSLILKEKNFDCEKFISNLSNRIIEPYI